VAGGKLEGDQYQSIITSAMPIKYSLFLNTILHSASVSGNPLTTEAIISMHLEQIRFDQNQEQKVKEESSALAAKFKGLQTDDKSNIESHNCGKKGHIKSECWSKGGGKEGQGPKQKKSKAKKKGTAKGAKREEAPEVEEHHALVAHTPGTALKFSGGANVVRPLDSGTSAHFEPDGSNFTHLAPCITYGIEITDGKLEYATYKGDIKFQCWNGGGLHTISLRNIYYTLWMLAPLISVASLRNNCYIFSNVTEGHCTLSDSTGKVILKIREKDSIYPIETWKPPMSAGRAAAVNRCKLTLREVHIRLGHVTAETICQIVRKGLVTGLDVDLSTEVGFCEMCVEGKQTRNGFVQVHCDP
jgi:hypothetical protein